MRAIDNDGDHTIARPVLSGQERLASQSELDSIRDILQQRKAGGERAETTLTPDLLSQEAGSPLGNGGGINRFLLCTIVWNVAREVKARGETNGERLSLPRIAREVLSSYLQAGEPSEQNLLDEDLIQDEIKKHLQELIKQSRMKHAEERRLDIESLVAAEQSKRRRQSIKL
jgi:hypothetical protein